MPNAVESIRNPGIDRPGPKLWLEVEDLTRAHDYLKEKGVTILEPPAEGGHMLVADPDGSALEIWERDSQTN